MPRSLPVLPSVRFLKLEAKNLLKAFKARNPQACKPFRLISRYAELADNRFFSSSVKLADAQYALALDYGYSSWKQLMAHCHHKPGAKRMRVFTRDLIKTHCVGSEWPDFLGQVRLGESFLIETEGCDPNGPVFIEDIEAGDNIAVYIERIQMLPPFEAPNGGPFSEGTGPPVPLEYREGYFYWPNHFRIKASPSVGDVAVLPEPTDEVLEACRILYFGPDKGKSNSFGWRTVVRTPRGKNCHQDCWALAEGSCIHMKAQVDGAGVCLDDVHGYIGQEELGFSAIEVRASVQIRVERSPERFIDWPLIETAKEIMVFSSYSSQYIHRPEKSFVDVVREAYRALREVVASRADCTIQEANSIVAAAADLKNCVLYGLGDYIQDEGKAGQTDWDIAVVACLPKDVFVD